MKQKIFGSACWTVMIVLGLVVLGCGSDGGSLLKEVSGVWARSQGAGTIAINLSGDSKTLVVDGKSYSATVERVEMGNHVVDLKVQNGSGQPEMWSILEVWDDMGVNYKLVLSHDGEREVLPKKAKS